MGGKMDKSRANLIRGRIARIRASASRGSRQPLGYWRLYAYGGSQRRTGTSRATSVSAATRRIEHAATLAACIALFIALVILAIVRGVW